MDIKRKCFLLLLTAVFTGCSSTPDEPELGAIGIADLQADSQDESAPQKETADPLRPIEELDPALVSSMNVIEDSDQQALLAGDYASIPKMETFRAGSQSVQMWNTVSNLLDCGMTWSSQSMSGCSICMESRDGYAVGLVLEGYKAGMKQEELKELTIKEVHFPCQDASVWQCALQTGPALNEADWIARLKTPSKIRAQAGGVHTLTWIDAYSRLQLECVFDESGSLSACTLSASMRIAESRIR